MTSFAVELDPAPAPRLACLVLLVHLAAAGSPWWTRAGGWLAVLLTASAVASLASSIAAVPGPHHRVAAAHIDGAVCRIRLRGSAEWQAGTLGPGSRAFADLVFLDIRTDGRRLTWLLPRSAVTAVAFRRLKARVRLSC